MAEAVQKIFPQAKIAIGPTIQDGFYYDFDIPDHTLTPDDLQLIEAEMKKMRKRISASSASQYPTSTNN